jgi:hypothetical protein
MPDSNEHYSASVDARKCALEAIATLANIKRIAADRILRPAGVPDPLIKRFLTGKDETTGESLTKRQGGAWILDELSRDGKESAVVRKIIDIAAKWEAYDLAQDEYKARAVAQKARELKGILEETETREKAEYERAAQERAERQQRERDSALRKESALLLAQFDHLSTKGEPQERGYLLQDVLNRLFVAHGIAVARSFQRNAGGEQIDGAFELDGWHYIVECRWRDKLAGIRELDGLYGQISRSGKQTMGLYLSINGWSEHVAPLIKQNTDKSIILMEGFDLRTVLAQSLDLRRLLKAKVTALNIEAEPYFPASKLL